MKLRAFGFFTHFTLLFRPKSEGKNHFVVLCQLLRLFSQDQNILTCINCNTYRLLAFQDACTFPRKKRECAIPGLRLVSIFRRIRIFIVASKQTTDCKAFEEW